MVVDSSTQETSQPDRTPTVPTVTPAQAMERFNDAKTAAGDMGQKLNNMSTQAMIDDARMTDRGALRTLRDNFMVAVRPGGLRPDPAPRYSSGWSLLGSVTPNAPTNLAFMPCSARNIRSRPSEAGRRPPCRRRRPATFRRPARRFRPWSTA